MCRLEQAGFEVAMAKDPERIAMLAFATQPGEEFILVSKPVLFQPADRPGQPVIPQEWIGLVLVGHFFIKNAMPGLSDPSKSSKEAASRKTP